MRFQHTLQSLQRRKSLLVVVLLLSIGFSSCKKFLEETSPNDVATGNMFQDANSLESARIGLYNTLQNVYYYGAYFPLMVDAYSDNGTTGGFDSPDLNELGDKTLTSANIYVQSTWIAIYNTIYSANQILDNVDGVNDPTLSDELRNDIKGEALAIRAMAHFDLLRMFGEHWDLNSTYGIPVVLHVVTPEDIIPRSTVAETYAAIINDLTTAEGILSNDDLRLDPPAFKGSQFVTKDFAEALLARVYLYKKDYANAAAYASLVIDNGTYSMVDDPSVIYTTKFSSESIFELSFNTQDRSQYNQATYSRPDALRTEVLFLANADLNTFFQNRPDDLRAGLVDFVNNDLSIEPDGRTQKYRGEDFQDNDALILRLSELYLIRAEARGLSPEGIDDLNVVHVSRGLTPYTAYDFDVASLYDDAIQDERRAELNFEGQRYFDLARIGKVQEILGESVLPVFPIPIREITATNGALEQYPGY